MNVCHRAHFLTVFFSLTKYFWVLLLPVARAVLAFGFDYKNAFKGYEADIFLLFILFCYALSRWLCTCVQISGGDIIYKRGFILRKTVKVTAENTSCIKLWQNPFSVIFRCFILRVYQNPTQKPIIKMYCTRQTAEKIKELCLMEEDKLTKYKSSPLLHSLIFSSNKGGFLVLSAMLSFSGVITGKTVRILAEENLAVLSDVARDIPSLLIALGLFLLLIRLISLLLEMIYVSDMRIYEQKDYMLIKRGILRKSLYRISTKRENLGYIVSTNSIFLCRYYSLYAGIAGFGQEKYDSPLILPIADKATAKKMKTQIFGDIQRGKNKVFAGRNAIGSYVTKWFVIYILSCLVFSAVASTGLLGNSPYLALLVPLCILFVIFVCVNKWRYSYVSITDNAIVLRTVKGIKISEYTASRDKCRRIQIRQNFLQKRKGVADLCLSLRGNRNKKVRIRHIPIEKCMEIAEKPRFFLTKQL